MSFGDALIYSLLGMCVVFFALILLMVIIQLMTAVSGERKKQPAPVSSAEAPASVRTAPGSAGDVKLYDTDPRTAAMLMAITADELKAPLNELRFISIREIKENDDEV